MSKIKTINDRAPNFRDKDNRLYLVRCFSNKCGPRFGKENYAMSVASGQCAWCGWKEEDNVEK